VNCNWYFNYYASSDVEYIPITGPVEYQLCDITWKTSYNTKNRELNTGDCTSCLSKDW